MTQDARHALSIGHTGDNPYRSADYELTNFTKENFNLKLVDVIEIDGVDTGDYPECCDSYISEATYDGVEMTPDEKDWLTDNHGEFVNNLALSYASDYMRFC